MSLTLLGWLAVAGPPALAGPWVTTTVDSVGTVGQYTSLALDAGKPRVSYHDATNRDLKYAACETDCATASSWTAVVVEADGNVGEYSSLALDTGKPRIAYRHGGTGEGLKYAACETDCTTASSWTTVRVDGEGQYVSLALDAGKPRISYQRIVVNDLKYAVCDADCTLASSWTTVTVDSVGELGEGTSLSLDAGKPRIAYRDRTNGDLRYATCDADCTLASSWTAVTVASVGDVGFAPSLALDAGRPRITYRDNTNGVLGYAACDADCTTASSWTTTTIDTVGSAGGAVEDGSLALDDGKPRVSYRNASGSNLKYAACEAQCTDSSNWVTEYVEQVGSVGRWNSLALDGDKPRLAYFHGGNGDLKYASCEANCPNATPAIASVADAPDPVTAGDAVSFSVGWTDPDDSVRAVVCKTNAVSAGACPGGAWAVGSLSSSSPSTASYTTSAAHHGANTYYAFVCDTENLCSASLPGTFTVSNRTPSIGVASDSPDPVGAGSAVTFSVTWTDPDDSVRAVVCKTSSVSAGACPGGAWAVGDLSSTSPSTASYTTSLSDVGTRAYHAFACDAQGACSDSLPGDFSVQSDPPSIGTTTDEPDPVVVGNQVAFDVSWTDPNPGDSVRAVVCKTNAVSAGACPGGAWAVGSLSSSSPSTASRTTVAADVGMNTYHAFACDSFDRCSGSLSGTFTVTNEAPAAPDLISPVADHAFFSSELQAFTMRATDPDGHAYSGSVTVRDAETGEVVRTFATAQVASGQDSSGSPSPPLAPGRYTWSAHATDAFGAQGSESAPRSFRVLTPSEECVTGANVVDGFVGDTYLRIRTRQVGGETWTCTRTDRGDAVNSGGKLVVRPGGSPPVAFVQDPAGPRPGPVVPAPGELASSLCQERGGARHVNADVDAAHVWLYTWQESDTRAHLCVRVQGTEALGGRLTVDSAATGEVVRVDTEDMTPCTIRLVDSSSLGLWHSPLGQTPISFCVLIGATGHQVRVSLDPGGAAPTPVTWTPDPGAPP